LVSDLRFVLSQALLEAFDFGLKVLNETLLPFQQFQKSLGREPAGLEFMSRLARVHTLVLCNSRAKKAG
jgi:hypothetical protein